MELSEALCHGMEVLWKYTEAFHHKSPMKECLSIIPSREAFENGRPVQSLAPVLDLPLRRVGHLKQLIGLSKETPILGDHPKAHIHEIRRISGEIRLISCGFRKTNCQEW